MSRRALRERERAQSQAEGANHEAPPGAFASVPPPQPMSPQPTSSPQTPPSQGVPQPQTAPSYRVRDYSPDARGTQFSTVGGTAPGGAEPVQPTIPVAPVAPPPDTPVAAAAAPVVESEADPVTERVLTRRELRELREAAERAANPEPPRSAEPEQPVAPPVASPAPPELIEPLEPRPQEFVAPQAQPQLQEPMPAPPLPSSPSLQQSLRSAPAPEWNAREPEPAPDVVMVSPEAYAPPVPEFELAPDYAEPVAEPVAAAPAVAVPPLPQASVVDVAAQETGFARPEGHWSRQADIDARTQLDDVLPSRDLSQSDAITTSALVLPSMPANPIGALSSTGEILVTGSIDLPRMLGATGVHPARFDHAEFDSIIEAGDREDSHPSSAPVRAIRAVSTHTSTQGIIAAKRPRSKVPTYVLAGVATVMGVGVVVLFVGGMLLDLF